MKRRKNTTSSPQSATPPPETCSLPPETGTAGRSSGMRRTTYQHTPCETHAGKGDFSRPHPPPILTNTHNKPPHQLSSHPLIQSPHSNMGLP
ncbi:hypothetical protein GBA52_025292 [Prunus armeniaca]|nr:hypothetical protein GBA52_025292 [Prunus armeniaca]